MAAGRVLVDSPPIPLETVRELFAGTGFAVEGLSRPWDGDDVVGVIAWLPVGEEDLARLPALKVVATCSVGYDHIDVAAAARRGVWVCNVPDYCVDEVADSALAHLLSLLRGTVVLDRSVRAGEWDAYAAGPLRRIAGANLGVIGFGRIGSALARRAVALGFEVWAADPYVAAETMAAAGVHPAPLDELLAACDAVSLHVPLTVETRGLIGERELALMPRGSFLVNTSRAAVLDGSAFLGALESGHLAGAAVDVLPVEPPTAEHPAPKHAALIVTPHAAWYSPESEQEVYLRGTRAVRTALEGRIPEGLVAGP